ncbi:hypothetical protein BIY23_04580 [Wolbachia pipientis]|uniref:Uncharacterized protein n=1 Tax=Wolbachia pipientis TaxID=955 RepID=A0A1E7QK97_WOLPI|nr:hypothetical protein [Wolbachia pipientis]OEY86873.1 hypothetical protein BIY23_04580 [Wolbachia pipientis]
MLELKRKLFTRFYNDLHTDEKSDTHYRFINKINGFYCGKQIRDQIRDPDVKLASINDPLKTDILRYLNCYYINRLLKAYFGEPIWYGAEVEQIIEDHIDIDSEDKELSQHIVKAVVKFIDQYQTVDHYSASTSTIASGPSTSMEEPSTIASSLSTSE